MRTKPHWRSRDRFGFFGITKGHGPQGEETEGQIRTAYPHEAKEPFSLVETRLDGFLTDSEVQALLTTLTRAA